MNVFVLCLCMAYSKRPNCLHIHTCMIVSLFIDMDLISECPDGFYGSACASQCQNCLDGAPCNASTGICETGCAAGFEGELCDTGTTE